VASDDVRKAFDEVDTNIIVEDHVHHISDPELMKLISIVLRGHRGLERKEGIDQGSALSPSALNLHLHIHLDQLLQQKEPTPSWFRYADNICYVCQDAPEGKQRLEQAQRLLQAVGLNLKGEDGPPINLKTGRKVQLLGLTLTYHEGRVRYNLGEAAWTDLKQTLKECHQEPNPPTMAHMVLQGWIGALGPTSENWTEHETTRLLTLCKHTGFYEVDPPKLLDHLARAGKRWQRLREETLMKVNQENREDRADGRGGSAGHRPPGVQIAARGRA
jgi:hypothetical protein